jgi:hypothetical protein
MDPNAIRPDQALGFQPVPETLAEIDEALVHAITARYWPYVDKLLDKRWELQAQETTC